MQDSAIDQTYRFRLDGIPGAVPDDEGFSMINPDLSLKIPAYSHKAFQWLCENTPVRISATGNDTTTGYAVIAGRSLDDQVVQVIIGDHGSIGIAYHITIDNLPWNTTSYTYERYVINDFIRLELAESEERSGSSTFQTIEDITAPEVHLIRLHTNDSTSVKDETIGIAPVGVRLNQNHPNPFRPMTAIPFTTEECMGNTKLVIYNISGQIVKILVDSALPAGEHSVSWDGTDENNQPVGSGVCFYQLQTDGGFSESKRMLLLK